MSTDDNLMSSAGGDPGAAGDVNDMVVALHLQRSRLWAFRARAKRLKEISEGKQPAGGEAGDGLEDLHVRAHSAPAFSRKSENSNSIAELTSVMIAEKLSLRVAEKRMSILGNNSSSNNSEVGAVSEPSSEGPRPHSNSASAIIPMSSTSAPMSMPKSILNMKNIAASMLANRDSTGSNLASDSTSGFAAPVSAATVAAAAANNALALANRLSQSKQQQQQAPTQPPAPKHSFRVRAPSSRLLVSKKEIPVFVAELVQENLLSVVSSVLTNKVFDNRESKQWCHIIAQETVGKLGRLQWPMKFVVHVLLLEQGRAGVNVVSGCTWNTSTDGSVALVWDSSQVHCVATAFGFLV